MLGEGISMRDITREQAMFVREHYPDEFIHVTGKGKSGRSKKYACEETTRMERILQQFDKLRCVGAQ